MGSYFSSEPEYNIITCKVCLTCNKKFWTNRSWEHYCSTDCYNNNINNIISKKSILDVNKTI